MTTEPETCGGAEVKRFPILGAGYSIPWDMIAPFEQQAQKNHGQSLQRLAERCGLDPSEALAVLECRQWERMDPDHARSRLLAKVAEYEAQELPGLRKEVKRLRAEVAELKRKLERPRFDPNRTRIR